LPTTSNNYNLLTDTIANPIHGAVFQQNNLYSTVVKLLGPIEMTRPWSVWNSDIRDTGHGDGSANSGL